MEPIEMHLKKIVDDMKKGWRAERALEQMTLSKFIVELQKFPKEKQIENICEPHSYRGYYSDLAFEKHHGTRTVGELLEELETKCLNQSFTGYKGGDFTMDKHTPLFIANYGDTGVKIVGIEDGEVLSLLTDNDEY